MAANSTTRLATGEGWITWFKTLKTKAMNEDLWEYLDPTKNNKPALISKEPVPPNIRASARNTRRTLAQRPRIPRRPQPRSPKRSQLGRRTKSQPSTKEMISLFKPKRSPSLQRRVCECTMLYGPTTSISASGTKDLTRR
ncbi:hypothetical protein B0T10DRAFT_466145 [Thelonectria olida]|uniref:Uncharacterized protein n=1 Tax=Thelonectria olida TaxID=1576542 RepID=A0A9P9AKX7_9HYPO|nr:hypothetical protein B0T10DRAFT_466145 [Thelonectria olida]